MPGEVVRESGESPKGSAGLVNQGTTGTVDQVAPTYSNLAEATQSAAMAKRDADQAVLRK